MRGSRRLRDHPDRRRHALCRLRLADRQRAGARTGVREATANAMTGRLRLVWDPAATRLSQPLQPARAREYTPCSSTGAARTGEAARTQPRPDPASASPGSGTMQAMMFAEALYLDTGNTMSGRCATSLRWITFLGLDPGGVPTPAGPSRGPGANCQAAPPRDGHLVATSTLLAYFASVGRRSPTGRTCLVRRRGDVRVPAARRAPAEQRARRVANAQVD